MIAWAQCLVRQGLWTGSSDGASCCCCCSIGLGPVVELDIQN